ncbi:hypothetical protein M0222_41410, partial [Myxococcus fulvus]|nr:hypothetical protein [Myxococcus fulvus]
MGVEGQGVQGDEGRGHHVLGEVEKQLGAERGGVDGSRGDVGDETLESGDVLADESGGVVDGRKGFESGLDLTQLDAEAAQLHLEVDAAEVLEVAVRQPAGLVPGAVEARAGDTRERIGDEALSGEVGPSEVAASDTVAANEELSRHADGGGLEGSVEDEGGDVGERRAESRPGGGGNGERGGVDGGFGGAVDVEGAKGGGGGESRPEGVVDGLTADEDAKGPQRGSEALVEEEAEVGGGAVEDVELVTRQPREK